MDILTQSMLRAKKLRNITLFSEKVYRNAGFITLILMNERTATPRKLQLLYSQPRMDKVYRESRLYRHQSVQNK